MKKDQEADLPPASKYISTAESRLLMGTLVTVRVVGQNEVSDMQGAIDRAFKAMHFVEESCSRFEENSALRELCRHPGEVMHVPDVIFETMRLALEMSALTEGAFDPTVGAELEMQGFNAHYLTGEVVHAHIAQSDPVSYRDITLDENARTILLKKPMLLDLGAVAKGLAVDLAAKELDGWEGFAIDAGGDVFVHGVDPVGEPWTVGIQHPVHKDKMICWLQVTDVAICTSGSYERRSPQNPEVHHLLNPITGESVSGLLSCSVIAPFAMLADAVSTTAFILGEKRALEFISELELEGICISESLEMTKTEFMERYMR